MFARGVFRVCKFENGPRALPRELSDASRGAPGRSWDDLVALLRRSGAFLGRSWDALGRSWAALGALLAALSRSWSPEGRFRLEFWPPEGRFWPLRGAVLVSARVDLRFCDDRLGSEFHPIEVANERTLRRANERANVRTTKERRERNDNNAAATS